MRRIRKKYERPMRPWDKARLERERKIMKEFGLRRKHELWRAEDILRNFRRQARDLIAVRNERFVRELLEKLYKIGLVEKNATLEDVLALKVEDILERRLQTVVGKKGISRGLKHSRQLIVHGHIGVGGVRTVFPSYLVRRDEQENIGFYETSPLRAVKKETSA